MCGRLVVTEPDISTLVESFEVATNDVAEWQPRYNLAPTQLAPLITNEPERRVTLARFGLLPGWAKDKRVANKLINARVEGIARSGAFKRALALKRGIIPVSGWLEWQQTARGKQPLLIHDDHDKPIALAGVWARWHGDEGEVLQSFAVLTRSAVGFLTDVHSRMPLALQGEAISRWLTPGEQTPDALASVLESEPDVTHLVTRPVSKLVNSPNNDTPECLSEATIAAATPETSLRQLELFESAASLRRTR